MMQKRKKARPATVKGQSEAEPKPAGASALRGKSFDQAMRGVARKAQEGSEKLHPVTTAELKALRGAVLKKKNQSA